MRNRKGELTDLILNGARDEISWTCRYLASVTVSSEPLIFKRSASTRNQIVTMGDLSTGFTINTFSSENYNTVSTSGLYLGSDLFVEIVWSVKEIKNVRFIVNDCYADVDGSQIDIVNDTCYSHALGAKFLSPKKEATVSSRFKYRIFAPRSSSLTVSTTLTCTVNICLKSPDTCTKQIITDTENCPKQIPNLLDFRV